MLDRYLISQFLYFTPVQTVVDYHSVFFNASGRMAPAVYALLVFFPVVLRDYMDVFVHLLFDE